MKKQIPLFIVIMDDESCSDGCPFLDFYGHCTIFNKVLEENINGNGRYYSRCDQCKLVDVE